MNEQIVHVYKYEIKEQANRFIKTLEITQSLLIALNTGGMIAVGNFFTSHDMANAPNIIKFAAILFFVGTIFGLLTIFCDFCISNIFFNNLLNINVEGLLNYQSKLQSKIKEHKILFKMFALGFLSFFFWMAGSCSAIAYIINFQCNILIAFIFLLLIILVCSFLYYWLESNFNLNSINNYTED